jgi:cytochrome c oxidase cbb3-type subunit 1
MNSTSAVHETVPADLNVAYNYSVVRKFTLATLGWGILGMAMGVFLAAQLVWPQLSFDLPWITFGRLRPVHSNARRECD